MKYKINIVYSDWEDVFEIDTYKIEGDYLRASEKRCSHVINLKEVIKVEITNLEYE